MLGIDENFVPTLLHQDDPDHKRLRGLVAKAFTVQGVEAMRGRIQQIADSLLDAVAGQGSFDVVEAYAKPLPTIVVAAMLGVNENDEDSFKRWSDNWVSSLQPQPHPSAGEVNG
jgi:cytochrome P450